MRTSDRGVVFLTLTLAMPLATTGTAFAEKPMSAIDWLSQSVALPVAMPLAPSVRDEAAVSKDARPEDISVTAIDAPNEDAVGMLPVSVTGLPRNLWGPTPTETVIQLLTNEQVDTLPALQALLYTLLMAEVTPPDDSDGSGKLFLARIDRLLDLGALDQAMTLLDLADATRPETFRRWFDVSLLLGQEDSACKTMRALPNVAPTFSARIFCLARGGDWNAAALTLNTAQALGYLTPEEDALLARFLDAEGLEDAPALPVPSRPSPLVWKMMEAIGEPMATGNLPVAFAQGDLGSNTGWKAQIEAAERLTRTGALPANQLLGLYTLRQAAASGGVWDRVTAMQAFDTAYAAGDAAAVAATLPEVWAQISGIELEVMFADLYGAGLAKLPLTGTTAALAFRIGLLSDDYEAVAAAYKPVGSDELFLVGLARGDLAKVTPPDGMGAAIRNGFTATATPQDMAALIGEGRIGEAILNAGARVTEGTKGDLRNVADGLATLRALGLEDVSRRLALELILLERRG